MIKEFAKGLHLPVSKEFTTADFDCRCKYSDCHVTYIDDLLMEALADLHCVYPKLTLQINSGFRCTRHNIDCKGKPGSYHLLGKAADVSSKNVCGRIIADAALEISSFNDGGIGIYPGFAHLDVRGYRSRWKWGS